MAALFVCGTCAAQAAKRWVKHVYQDVVNEVVEELYFYRVQ
ncbi:MAG TPA: hypothetical protein VFB93_03665 [Burkholderiales bacterium]|nr:hypothetical protein [Burkholderiales bacterium]